MKVALAGARKAGPFMALSAAGGIRPGVYAGWDGSQLTIPFGSVEVSAPFTGLLPALGSARSPLGLKPLAARRPVNGPALTKNDIIGVVAPLQPGVNAGPNTACGGKGRKRPSLPTPSLAAAALSPARHITFPVPRAAALSPANRVAFLVSHAATCTRCRKSSVPRRSRLI
jgi:hypothetical protein